MAVTALSGQRWQGTSPPSNVDTIQGSPAVETGSQSEATYKQITGLTAGASITHMLWDRYTVSAMDFKFALYDDDSNTPNNRLGNEVTIAMPEIDDAYTTQSVATSGSPVVPSDGIVWVASMAEDNTSVMNWATCGGSSVYSKSIYDSGLAWGTGFASTSSATSQGACDMRAGVTLAVSGDVKPTDVPVGSEFEQTDDYKTYQYGGGGYEDGLGSSANGTITNGATASSQLPPMYSSGDGVDFNGSSAKLISDADVTGVGTGAVTMTAWCRGVIGGSGKTITSTRNSDDRTGLYIYVSGSDTISSSMGESGSGAFSDSTWTFTALTRDGSSNGKFYWATVGSDTLGTATLTNSTDYSGNNIFDVAFDDGSGGEGQFWNGQIAEVSYWTRQLSDAEIAFLWNTQSGRKVSEMVDKSGLELYYTIKADDASTSVATNIASPNSWVERGTAI